MKILKYIVYSILISLLISSCNDDFMDKQPKTSISAGVFFKSIDDLQTYTNNLYGLLSYSSNDLFSDNIGVYTGGSTLDRLLRGKIDASNVGGWSKSTWGNLRNINFMLERVDNIKGDEKEINHYIGIARLLRAHFYYNMIKQYGDVPWYDTTIGTGDKDLLMKAKDSREIVFGHIVEDLEYAVANILPIGSRTRINQYAALQEQARIYMYEASFRKYHTELLSLKSTANDLYGKAIVACQKIMDSGEFTITGSSAQDYLALFNSNNLSSNKAMILYRDYDLDLGVGNNNHAVLDWQWSLSKSLADTYLMKDGTPATLQTDYNQKGYVEMFTDRDPRMAETILPPNYIIEGDLTPYIGKVTFGGLPQIKFYPREAKYRLGWYKDYCDLPIYRYAETLLTYAEAKAELEQITQNDLDKTINLIRQRVDMPNLSMDVITDPMLELQYPNVQGSNKAVTLEIRRERRVELACEGFRWDDIKRWNEGELMAKPFEGYYISALGPIDVTGDEVPDIAILNSSADKDNITGLTDDVKNSLIYYYLIKDDGNPNSFYLSEGDHGNIRFGVDKENPRTFVSPKYYYYPLPFDQIRDNKNLTQSIGWE